MTATEVQRTDRGFEFIDFNDDHGNTCTIQQSSVIKDYDDAICRPGSSCIWLGIKPENHMHLDRDQVKWLRKKLKIWLKTGSFENC